MRIHEDLLGLFDCHLPFLKALHRERSLAPLAASMDVSGEVTGYALTARPDAGASPVDDALDRFAQQFHQAFQNRTITASALFFHGCFAGDQVRPAQFESEANALVAWLDHRSGQSIQAIVRYSVNPAVPAESEPYLYDAPSFTQRD